MRVERMARNLKERNKPDKTMTGMTWMKRCAK
jgi:hypothetical protein